MALFGTKHNLQTVANEPLHHGAAITEMVPNLIWAPRSLVQEKFGPPIKIITWLFHAVLKLFRDQISRSPNLLGPQKVRRPNEIRDLFSYSQRKRCFSFVYLFVKLLATFTAFLWQLSQKYLRRQDTSRSVPNAFFWKHLSLVVYK